MDSEKQPTPTYLVEAAECVTSNLLPEKSKEKYIVVYNKFLEWRKEKKATSFSENVLMAYFSELSKMYKPSTLWSYYSMLRSTINTSENINIKNYFKLIAFLKKQSVGFKSKKSKVLSSENIEKFLNEAPDEIYLATKVILIFGINGACRRDEICSISIQDVKEHSSSLMVVNLPNTKTNMSRTFMITNSFYEIVKKYSKLRPKNVKCDRFFLNYTNGKCTQQPIGINKIGNMPRQIATYFNLPESELYTSHSFRRASATLLADAGADITTLKRHGGWRANNVAEGYVEDSINNKRKISGKIFQSIQLNEPKASTSRAKSPEVSTFKKNENPETHEPDEDFIPSKTKKLSEENMILTQSQNFATINKKHYNLSNIQLPNNITFNNCSNITVNFSK